VGSDVGRLRREPAGGDGGWLDEEARVELEALGPVALNAEPGLAPTVDQDEVLARGVARPGFEVALASARDQLVQALGPAPLGEAKALAGAADDLGTNPSRFGSRAPIGVGEGVYEGVAAHQDPRHDREG